MSKIEVDHSKFKTTSESINAFISESKKKMSEANEELFVLGWQGNDAEAFKNKWQEVSGDKSYYREFVTALENYADFLDYAAEKYKEAQINAVNRANGIPKIF